MNNLDDFDRSLSAFLRDGPSTAPEAPVIAALAHARTTPRRRGLVAALRPDVMARPRRSLSLRSALVLGVVGLVAASIGIAVVGSRPQQSVPPVTVTPSPGASGAPSSTPAPAESAATFGAVVSMIVAGGAPLEVTVTDTTGDLRRAESVDPGTDGASVDGVRIEADPSDPAAMLVRWVGASCERVAAAVVDEPSRTIALAPEACDGDTFPYDRVLRLTFAGPIDPELWAGRIVAAGEPHPTPTLPPATSVDLGTSEGRTVTADIHDLSGHLTGVTVVPGDRAAPADVVDVRNVDRPQTLLIAWPGHPCDSIHRITVATDFGIRIERPTCRGAGEPLTWAIRIDFDVPVSADAVDKALVNEPHDATFPAFVVTGVDSTGATWQLAIADPSGTIANPAALAAGQATDPGPDGVRLDQDGDAIVRMTWRGPACATTATLTLDPVGKTWQLEAPSCAPSGPEVIRVLHIKLRNPLSVDAITITRTTAPPA